MKDKTTSKAIRVLLAEDEEHIAKLIQFKLTKEGFQIAWAKDGKEAISLIHAESWDAILLDVMMPYLDGWRVLQQIRGEQYDTPVLMLTAKGTENDVSKSLELGATRFLKKPFNPAELVDVLNEMLVEKDHSLGAPSIWETDPEMKKMKQEFVASFSDRKAILKKCLDRLSDLILNSENEKEITQIAYEIRVVAHNLAGIAKNYGFEELGTRAAAIDDDLAAESKVRTAQELVTLCECLDRAMF